MATQTTEPTYTGIDKFPGIIATVVTLVVGGIFLGALYNSATSGHGGDHGGEHAAEHADEGGH